ncbi:2og-fe oxygenase superfamily [Fusarium heterosporum]|uniref:2og-fe oxygenase superfamily n=1 Tax=Fusarium heterosporum TaxID=42747 RepID=A0A8H5TB93_FUSHE|nr:2og-fe oxygenase superfamily [Fusarium heterosporum]
MFAPFSAIEISDGSSDDSHGDLTEDNRELLHVLDSIQSTGKIATFNRYSAFVNPGLTIEGEHLIPLPLKGDDAQAIKSVCRQAPFGHGDKTVVDTSVRNTWELDASKFELANSEWPSFFDRMLEDTAKGLGFQMVVAKPHKLLLYEPGSFFKPHKDSEKEQGMIGTLVVCLPSQHEGSDVHLSSGSQVTSYSTAPSSKFDLTSISWYSDVTHEVTTLISGYRLILTYKLFVLGEEPFSASAVLEQTDHLKTTLNKWQARSPDLEKLMYPLDHLYTESSLCLQNLKGRDRAVTHTLNNICSAAGFYLLLAHATHVKNGEDGYGAWGDDSEEDHTVLNAVYTLNGSKVASNVDIKIDEILGYSISKEDPDSEDEGEFTGNENAPPTFRYHKTVVVILPKVRLRQYLSKHSPNYMKGPSAENDCLTEMVCQDLANNRNDPYTKQVATNFISDVLDFSVKPKGEIVGLISKWALELGNIPMFRACVKATYVSVGLRPDHVNAFPFYAYRKAISEELVNHFRVHCDGKEQSIDWDHWLQDLKSAPNTATEFDAFCTVFETCTTHQPLLTSFKAWADPISDKKLEEQSVWAGSDLSFILGTLKSRNADREWILQSFLPAIIPQASRHFLWGLLHRISLERATAFPNSGELYKSIIQHGRQKLCLSELDIGPYAPRYLGGSHDQSMPCQEFVRVLEEGHINGSGQEVLDLLELSCKRLVEKKGLWSSVSAIYLRRNFLEPLIKALETYKVPSVPAVQGFFEVALRDIFHKPINVRPAHLPGWAHEERDVCSRSSKCGECQQMNDFLKNPEQQQWHYKAGKASRDHVESQLRDPIYSLETLKIRSPHTLVVTKRGTNYEKALRTWKQAFRGVDDSVYCMRSDYLKSFMGEEKYKELFLLEKPGQEDLRNAMTLTRPREGGMVPPSAKRTRLW